MTPGPTVIRECGQCKGMLAQQTIGSGNTFGATYWTDGKCEAPMLPVQPPLVKCPHCSAVIWIEEQTQQGETEPESEASDAFKGARPPLPATFDDYIAVLRDATINPERQCHLRVMAWWAGNDTRRRARPGPAFSAAEAQNLTALADMLQGADPGDRIMKAECLRELGRFDEAMATLTDQCEGGFGMAVETIKRLSEAGETRVAMLKC